jgi:MHS family shikimate/dehydroshikimate transporter-like MFS transporter
VERLGGEERGQTSAIGKVALASLIGTTIEWYDFFIYGTAALVFPALFFPQFSETAGTLAAYATFGVGFLARPVGGIIFGHFGDRIGRKTMLVLTLTIMGIATTLIGLMPTYAAIGVAAPILLIVLRFCQGLGVGGEWGGAVLMGVEHSPPEKRGFYGSWPQMGVPAGLILSNLIFLTQVGAGEQYRGPDAHNRRGARLSQAGAACRGRVHRYQRVLLHTHLLSDQLRHRRGGDEQ